MDDGFDGGRLGGGLEGFSMLRSAATERLRQALGPKGLAEASPLSLAELANDTLEEMVAQRSDKPSMLEQRTILQEVVAALRAEKAAAEAAARAEAAGSAAADPVAGIDPLDDPLIDPLADHEVKNAPEAKNKRALQVKAQVMPLLMQRIDISVASTLGPEELRNQIAEIVEEIIVDLRIQLCWSTTCSALARSSRCSPTRRSTTSWSTAPSQVYIERRGKLELTDVVFRDDSHVLNVATRIVTRIGRRIDESSPLVDARLPDGSRVNIIIPPLAIDGPSISIRKFAKKKITLDTMMATKNLSAEMATVLKIASRCRLNIMISGGTGSGKTTLLNALSQLIDPRRAHRDDRGRGRVAAPAAARGRLETRPANIEGHGEITMRDLVKNALRMRPDRIILGEIRGEPRRSTCCRP
jgi:pilus assembly protein CpaF